MHSFIKIYIVILTIYLLSRVRIEWGYIFLLQLLLPNRPLTSHPTAHLQRQSERQFGCLPTNSNELCRCGRHVTERHPVTLRFFPACSYGHQVDPWAGGCSVSSDDNLDRESPRRPVNDDIVLVPVSPGRPAGRPAGRCDLQSYSLHSPDTANTTPGRSSHPVGPWSVGIRRTNVVRDALGFCRGYMCPSTAVSDRGGGGNCAVKWTWPFGFGNSRLALVRCWWRHVCEENAAWTDLSERMLYVTWLAGNIEWCIRDVVLVSSATDGPPGDTRAAGVDERRTT